MRSTTTAAAAAAFSTNNNKKFIQVISGAGYMIIHHRLTFTFCVCIYECVCMYGVLSHDKTFIHPLMKRVIRIRYEWYKWRSTTIICMPNMSMTFSLSFSHFFLLSLLLSLLAFSPHSYIRYVGRFIFWAGILLRKKLREFPIISMNKNYDLNSTVRVDFVFVKRTNSILCFFFLWSW